jgi:DNA-binding beta-propeller fold protein YncE
VLFSARRKSWTRAFSGWCSTSVTAVMVLAACGAPGGAQASPTPAGATSAPHIAGALIYSGGFVALDAQGNLYVSSGDNGPNPRISKLSPAGQLLLQFVGFSPNVGVEGVAVDSVGNVYGADEGTNQVVKFSPTGKVIAKIGGAAQIGQPSGLAVDSHDALYVADQGQNAIDIYSTAGSLRQRIVGDFVKPRGVAIDAGGNLYITDHDNNRVEKLDPSGRVLATWGSGVGGVTLSYPIDVGLDAQGDVYVTDPGDSALQKISPGGKVLATWPAAGGYHPIAVAVQGDGTTFDTEDDPAGTSARVVKRSPAGVQVAVWK